MASITASPGCHSVRMSERPEEGWVSLVLWCLSWVSRSWRVQKGTWDWGMICFLHSPHFLIGSHSSGTLSQGPETPGFLTWPLSLSCCFPCHGGLHMLILVYTLFWHGLIMSHEFIYHFNINDSHIQRNSYHKVMTSLTSPEQFSPGTPFSKCQNQNSPQIQNLLLSSAWSWHWSHQSPADPILSIVHSVSSPPPLHSQVRWSTLSIHNLNCKWEALAGQLSWLEHRPHI